MPRFALGQTDSGRGLMVVFTIPYQSLLKIFLAERVARELRAKKE